MGPSELNEDKIPVAAFAMDDWMFGSKPTLDGGYKNSVSQFLVFVGSVLGQPVARFANAAAMLAGTSLAINYLAYTTDTGILYLYNGPDQGDIANYTVIVRANPNRGDWDASSNTMPTTGGSTGGIPQRGDRWRFSLGGTIGGVPYPAGTVIELFGTDYTDVTHWRFY